MYTYIQEWNYNIYKYSPIVNIYNTYRKSFKKMANRAMVERKVIQPLEAKATVYEPATNLLPPDEMEVVMPPPPKPIVAQDRLPTGRSYVAQAKPQPSFPAEPMLPAAEQPAHTETLYC